MTIAYQRAVTGRRAGRSLSLRRREELTGYLFISPQVLGFLVIVLGPIVAVVVYSLQNRTLLAPEATFAGLENYRHMVESDPYFRRMLLTTAIFCAGLVPINVGLGLCTALLLSSNRRGDAVFQAIFFLPVVTSAVAWAVVWRYAFQGELGPINQFLAVLGVTGPNWLQEPTWALVVVTVTRALKTVGLKMVIFIAAIQGIPKEPLEAARLDGANSWHVFRHIMLPFLAPATFLVVVITMIGSMQVFDHILLMTAGGPSNATMVLPYYIFHQAFRAFDTGYASALAVVLCVLTLGLTTLQWAVRRRVVPDEQ
ncbi:MAG TPA: sugar ABC transporter permease [Actinopolymorphaceae bacterium]